MYAIRSYYADVRERIRSGSAHLNVTNSLHFPFEGVAEVLERVRILEDKIDRRLKKARLKAESAGRQWAYLTVPLVEGKQYTTGEITVTGNEVFTDEEILGQFV